MGMFIIMIEIVSWVHIYAKSVSNFVLVYAVYDSCTSVTL